VRPHAVEGYELTPAVIRDPGERRELAALAGSERAPGPPDEQR
jgi:hypothetical protein